MREEWAVGVRVDHSVIVVMGVSGCGKSTVGRLLAQRLGVAFAEADDFHPPANVAKMASGQPLDDADRLPWLAAIAEWISGQLASGEGGVVTCSALKHRYRDLLRQAGSRLWFVHLEVPRDVIVARVAARTGHFMPASLVDSQFAALEPLRPAESGVVVDGDLAPDEILDAVVARLAAPTSPSPAITASQQKSSDVIRLPSTDAGE
jgi:gluconokinase